MAFYLKTVMSCKDLSTGPQTSTLAQPPPDMRVYYYGRMIKHDNIRTAVFASATKKNSLDECGHCLILNTASAENRQVRLEKECWRSAGRRKKGLPTDSSGSNAGPTGVDYSHILQKNSAWPLITILREMGASHGNQGWGSRAWGAKRWTETSGQAATPHKGCTSSIRDLSGNHPLKNRKMLFLFPEVLSDTDKYCFAYFLWSFKALLELQQLVRPWLIFRATPKPCLFYHNNCNMQWCTVQCHNRASFLKLTVLPHIGDRVNCVRKQPKRNGRTGATRDKFYKGS